MPDNHKETRLRSASQSTLPLASVIDDPETFKRAVAALKKLLIKHAMIDKLEEEKAALKDDLMSICAALDLKGVRHGKVGFEYDGWKTRKTLSNKRLLELGVPAETIDQAYVESSPFQMSKIVVFDID